MKSRGNGTFRMTRFINYVAMRIADTSFGSSFLRHKRFKVPFQTTCVKLSKPSVPLSLLLSPPLVCRRQRGPGSPEKRRTILIVSRPESRPRTSKVAYLFGACAASHVNYNGDMTLDTPKINCQISSSQTPQSSPPAPFKARVTIKFALARIRSRPHCLKYHR